MILPQNYIPLLYLCYPPRLSPIAYNLSPIAYRAADVALMLRRCYNFPSNLTYSLIVYWGPHEIIVRPKGDKNFVSGESGGTCRPNVASNIHCDLVAERVCKV